MKYILIYQSASNDFKDNYCSTMNQARGEHGAYSERFCAFYEVQEQRIINIRDIKHNFLFRQCEVSGVRLLKGVCCNVTTPC